MSQKSAELQKSPARQEKQAERERRILTQVKRKDSRTAAHYAEMIQTDKGLTRLIKRDRCPFIVQQFEKWHVVFPPSPMNSRRNNAQQITNTTPYADHDKYKYVFHTAQPGLEGPKCICSYLVVSESEARILIERIVRILTELGRADDAAVYKAGIEVQHPF